MYGKYRCADCLVVFRTGVLLEHHKKPENRCNSGRQYTKTSIDLLKFKISIMQTVFLCPGCFDINDGEFDGSKNYINLTGRRGIYSVDDRLGYLFHLTNAHCTGYHSPIAFAKFEGELRTMGLSQAEVGKLTIFEIKKALGEHGDGESFFDSPKWPIESKRTPELRTIVAEYCPVLNDDTESSRYIL